MLLWTCFLLQSMLIRWNVIMRCPSKHFFYQIPSIGDTTDIQVPSQQAPPVILPFFKTLWKNWCDPLRSLRALRSLRSEGRTFCFWGQIFKFELITWHALVWREKTKGRMSKILLFCHVKWSEVMLTFGFLPITEAFMNFQLCQENITCFTADYPPGVNCIISYSEEDYRSHFFSG